MDEVVLPRLGIAKGSTSKMRKDSAVSSCRPSPRRAKRDAQELCLMHFDELCLLLWNANFLFCNGEGRKCQLGKLKAPVTLQPKTSNVLPRYLCSFSGWERQESLALHETHSHMQGCQKAWSTKSHANLPIVAPSSVLAPSSASICRSPRSCETCQ